MFRVCLLGICFLAALYPQSRQGRILDVSGAPVSQAFLIHGEDWCSSTPEGVVYLPPGWQCGDTIRVHRYGYRSQTLPLPADSLLIILTPDPLLHPVVEVAGTGTDFRYGTDPGSAAASPSAISGWKSRVEILPAVRLRSYGSPGSVQTISIDGGPATQVEILLDGFSLSNAQNGVTDLNQLPLTLAQAVTYTPPGPAAPDYSDGQLEIRTRDQGASLRWSQGSFGHQLVQGVYPVRRTRHHLLFRSGLRRDEGNFPVRREGENHRRQHNRFLQEYLQISGQGWPRDRWTIRWIAFGSHQLRQNPGLIYSPSPGEQEDHLLLAGLRSHYLLPGGEWFFRIQSTQNDTRYENPQLQLHARHRLVQHAAEGSFRSQSHILSTTATLKIQQSRLSSTAAGRRHRETGDLQVLLRTRTRWEGVLSATQEAWSHHRPLQGWFVSLGTASLLSSHLRLRLARGTTFRLPTFNELYWTPGGNLHLQPERTAYLQGDLALHGKRGGVFQVTLFAKRSHNLIQWTPRGSFWRPVNLQVVDRKGWKFRWTLPRIPGGFQATLSAGSVRATNLTPGETRGKPLPYVPRRTGSLRWSYPYRRWTLTHVLRYRDAVISRYDWPEDVRLPAVTLQDVVLSWQTTFHRWNWTLTGSIENLGDVRYETVQGYPEPGRALAVTLTIEPKETP